MVHDVIKLLPYNHCTLYHIMGIKGLHTRVTQTLYQHCQNTVLKQTIHRVCFVLFLRAFLVDWLTQTQSMGQYGQL